MYTVRGICNTSRSVRAYNWHIIDACTTLPLLFLQVTLPEDLVSRCGHSATAFGSGGSFRVVVLFGGHNRDAYLSETTLLLMGKCAIYLSVLHEICKVSPCRVRVFQKVLELYT